MIGLLFMTVAGLIHVSIFLLESVFWNRPATRRIFGLTKEAAEQNRDFAFNQGFYNLFLALMVLAGVALPLPENANLALMLAGGLAMFGASLVLIVSKPKLVRASLIQGAPPLIGIVCLLLGF